jgi:predicted rRNA methylase YqxC with S4 and FtsJ domains
MRLLKENGIIVSLIKPHYEAEAALLRGGILPVSEIPTVMAEFEALARAMGLTIVNRVESPIKGTKGNCELLVLLQRQGM